MKVGLITFYKNNYGSILQCYATKRKLSMYGVECFVLNRLYDENIFQTLTRLFRIFFTAIRYHSFLKIYLKMKKSFSNKSNALSHETLMRMNRFVEEKINPKLYSYSILKKMGSDPSYAKFIVGSDQVWNCSFLIDDLYFLTFCPDEKKVAFGVSFGVQQIPNYNSSITKKIKKFNQISAREESGMKLLSTFYDKDVVRIGDPTIMLSRNDWISFCQKGCSFDFEYILLHFLNEPNRIALEFVKKYAVDCSLKIVCVGCRFNAYDYFDECVAVDASPEDYVKLILNARQVFTDSFHSTLFSINLNVNFYCFSRNYLHSASQESRKIDLLTRCGLLRRYVVDVMPSGLEDIDYSFDYLLSDRLITCDFLKRSVLCSQ